MGNPASTGSGGKVGRLRIAAHNGAWGWGGAEIATVRLLAGLHARGHSVRLYCTDPEVRDRASAQGVPAGRQHLGGDLALHHAYRFARELQRQRPDVLLLTTFKKLWLGAMAARLAGVPRVIARIGLETDTPRNAKYRFVLGRWIDAVVFNAEGMRRTFIEQLPTFPGQAVTIHTGVRVPVAGGGPGFRAKMGISPGAPLVGSVGRLVEQKRYDRLIDVVATLPLAHAVVIGEGPLRGDLERRAADRGVADRFHLPGHLDDVGPALDAMDLFVLTSDREGMSNAMLEALAAGVPVVSTDVSGAREALEPTRARGPDAGRAPGIVTDFDVSEIAGVVRLLLDDPRRLEAMGEAARGVAGARFSRDRMLDDWEAVLGAPSSTGSAASAARRR